MRHAVSKILLLTTLFLPLYTIPSFCDTNPYINKMELKSTVSDITAAILQENVDRLMELSELSDSFQIDKRDHLNSFLKNYFDRIVKTTEIEVTGMEIKSDDEAEVTVRVHLSTRKDIDGMDIKPRDKVWNFVKGRTGSVRNKWLLLLE